MSFTEIVVQGALGPDGTLQLDEKPNLPPGQVTVMVRQAAQPAPPKEDWWPYMQRVRAEREAAGYHFMNEQEMRAHLDWLRDESPVEVLP